MAAATQRSSEAGLTLAEVLVVALIMSVLMIMITESMTALTGARAGQKAAFLLGDVGDRVARRIEEDVAMSTRVFGNGADDVAYLQAMSVGSSLLAAGRRLPQVTDNGFFRADPPDVPETGNVLFLSPRGPRVAIRGAGHPDRLVQTMRFVVYAPVRQGEQIDLLRWFSQPVVNYWDLADITDTSERADVTAQLHEAGVRYAWDAQSPRSSGLYELTPAGGLQLLPENRRVQGEEDPATSRPFGTRHVQLAQAGALPAVPIPAYGTSPAVFECAFEVKVDGSNSGKLVLLRFVVVPARRHSRPVWSEVQRLRSTSG